MMWCLNFEGFLGDITKTGFRLFVVDVVEFKPDDFKGILTKWFDCFDRKCPEDGFEACLPNSCRLVVMFCVEPAFFPFSVFVPKTVFNRDEYPKIRRWLLVRLLLASMNTSHHLPRSRWTQLQESELESGRNFGCKSCYLIMMYQLSRQTTKVGSRT